MSAATAPMPRDGKRKAIVLELEGLRRRGLIEPKKVVAFAKNPRTAMHALFTWDDSKAAAQHRLWQARVLIRTYTIEVVHGKVDPMPRNWSLAVDRHKGGGYRSIDSIMGNAEFRAQLLGEAKAELMRVRRKYRLLTELDAVWKAIDET